MRFLDDNDIILFGPHTGELFESVILKDFDYCLWLKDQIWVQTNEKLLERLNKNKAIRYALIGGTHKGLSIKQIIEIDPAYVERLRNDPVILKDFPHIVEQLIKLPKLC